ncbi:glycosyltransferase family 4 protein [Kocuria carniphila]|uniref:glycosyltransferase family 4 protein n=1 Tax=Kocuria carniphila TaxID=262208 RepID=UPI0013EA079D|nr:glycosyltransferase family 4 protein [Kocuria carniphila]
MKHVIVMGPRPDSAGGIGVMMGHLSRSRSDKTQVHFVESGGAPGARLGRLAAFGKALLTCWGPVPEDSAFHVNISTRGSTWRKLILTGALRVRRRPYILHLHGGRYREFYRDLPAPLASAVRSMFRNAGGVVVLGSVWKAFVTEVMGVTAEKVHVIANAVPGPAEVPGDRAEPVVLFTGKVTRAKGVIELLKAWKSLPDNIRTRLVLAGDLHDPDGEISRLLKDAPAVTTTGWLSGTELDEQLSAASILVLPSHAENLPLSLLDGMAWGLAPVATDVGSVAEVVLDGETGWIVPVNDAETLAHVLESLLLDPTKREALAHAARDRWEEFYDIAQYRDRLDEVYEQVT